uniref:Uncharacterized protein n=1 Tax=Naja naja TaxID=35670 RepID=A0A8C6XA72_NAJNA
MNESIPLIFFPSFTILPTTEALTCNNCSQFKIGFDCVSRESSLSCIAQPGQKCKVVKSFLGTGIIKQGCTKSIEECDLNVFNKTVGPVKTTCCDDHDHCNTP